jgi:serine protease Do
MPRNSSTLTTLSISRGESAAVAVVFCLTSWALGPLNAAVAEQAVPAAEAASTSLHHEARTNVHGAWLGLTVQPLTGDIALSLGLPRAHGAVVSDVDTNGPAARVGLKPGDVILAVDGRPIASEDDLIDQISCKEPGTAMTLDVWHDGRRETLSPRVAELPEADVSLPVPAWSPNARWGIVVEPLTSAMAEVLAMPSSANGVVVTAVDPHGAGAASGLETIDVIEQVNGRPVGSAAELRHALEHASSKPALLFIDRNGLTMFLTMRTDQR